MKRWLIGIFGIIFLIGIATASYFHLSNPHFSLDAEYYGTAELQTIALNELRALVDERKSFGLFVSQPSCQASADLEKRLGEFFDTYPLKFYEISFSILKDSEIIPGLRFYPSFVIFRDGKVVDFLEANSDDDADAYTSADGFADWFLNYVELRT